MAAVELINVLLSGFLVGGKEMGKEQSKLKPESVISACFS